MLVQENEYSGETSPEVPTHVQEMRTQCPWTSTLYLSGEGQTSGRACRHRSFRGK